MTSGPARPVMAGNGAWRSRCDVCDWTEPVVGASPVPKFVALLHSQDHNDRWHAVVEIGGQR